MDAEVLRRSQKNKGRHCPNQRKVTATFEGVLLDREIHAANLRQRAV